MAGVWDCSILLYTRCALGVAKGPCAFRWSFPPGLIKNDPRHFGLPKSLSRPQKSLSWAFRSALEKIHRKNMEKNAKIEDFDLPKPSQNLTKYLRNRCSKKHGIFQGFLLEKCFVAKVSTSTKHWFFPIRMALGRFSLRRFLHGFSGPKTIPKPLKNHARTLPKSMLKTCCFLTSFFSGFGLDFGASWASKLEPSWQKIAKFTTLKPPPERFKLNLL